MNGEQGVSDVKARRGTLLWKETVHRIGEGTTFAVDQGARSTGREFGRYHVFEEPDDAMFVVYCRRIANVYFTIVAALSVTSVSPISYVTPTMHKTPPISHTLIMLWMRSTYICDASR
jgi:hypothetical protein